MLWRRIDLRVWWFLLCAGPLCVLLAVSVGAPGAPAYALFGAGASLAAGVDGAERRLPNRLTLPLAVICPAWLAVAAWGTGQPGRAGRMVLGALALGCCYLALHLANPAGMGMGDVKLAVSVGAVLAWASWDVWWAGALLGPILGAGTGLVLRRRSRAPAGGPGPPATFPFGPPMVAGAVGALLAVGTG